MNVSGEHRHHVVRSDYIQELGDVKVLGPIGTPLTHAVIVESIVLQNHYRAVTGTYPIL
jgi:hypothetical protein